MGRVFTEETKQKMRDNHVGFTGKKHAPKTIEKMRRDKLGSKNPMWGKEVSAETRKKLSIVYPSVFNET